MSDQSEQNDPSMKEILGSIRRIISEDNAQSDAENAETDEEDALELTDEVIDDEPGPERHEPVLVASGGREAAAASEPEVRREPILGLHSPDTLATPDEPDESPEIASPEPPILPDVTRLNPATPELVREPELEPEVEPEPVPEPASVVEEEPENAATEAEEVAAMAHSPETQQSAPEVSDETVDKIVSESATTAAASALGELTRAMDEKSNKLKVGSSEETISDMVREMIRPMLREWLDQNLSGIVERIVRREIQKLVDRAETED